ncbi:MAG: cytochrome c3 family protein [Sulfurimicrobium sp.]|nr:cytochrome c3 family protein [Sulfurimicrobium sp.]
MKTRNYAWLAAVLLLSGLLGWTASGMAGIAGTKHNLSVTGTGTYKATSETQLCVFCHTPHNTNPAVGLWNHELSAATYTPYASNTLAAAAPGQPSGASKLCLTCHDGTVALGGVRNLPFGHQTAGTISGLEALLTGTANLGTDLRNDHPVSFTYDASLAATNLELVSPAALTGKIKPDGNGLMQCTSCHDAHSDAYPKFMHVGYTDGAGYGSPLCRTCHTKMYWGTVANMPHREQTKPWNGLGINPWHVPGHNLANDSVNSTNKANGCESCHQPHNAATSGNRILKQDGETGVCLVCHNGNVAYWNIDAAMNKMYAHPSKNAAYDGRHKPKRMPDGTVREDQADLANRHAECEDCHNPHAVAAGVSPSVPNPTNNLAAPVNKGVWGVQPTWPGLWGQVTSYTVVPDVQYQYQLCLKCHSYYAFGASPPLDPYGIIVGGVNTDQALEFNPNNASYHPVVTTGKNNFQMTVNGVLYDYSSSLIGGMTPNSTMTCSECHSDSNPALPGLKGPHGADVWPIIWGPYDFTTGQPGTDNHICFKCHDPTVYGAATGASDTTWWKTGFSSGTQGVKKNLHVRHVVARDMPCLGCHSLIPHGWKRRALLIYGTGTIDPEPYNGHSKFPINGSSVYGIPSARDVDAMASGQWRRSDCHNTGTGVGSC